MRALKVVFLIIVLISAVALVFAGPMRYYVKESGASDVRWEWTGVDADTSKTYTTYGIMTLLYIFYDQIHEDSVDVDLSFQMYGTRGWYTERSLTVTADSTEGQWEITAAVTASCQMWRLVATSGGDNCKDAAVYGYFVMDQGN